MKVAYWPGCVSRGFAPELHGSMARVAPLLDIEDRNNGARHEHAFVKNIRKNGILHEADLLPDSYGGKFHPRAVPELVDSLPVITKALMRRKVTPGKALRHTHKAPKEVKRIFRDIHDREERYELNLYVVGEEEDDE